MQLQRAEAPRSVALPPCSVAAITPASLGVGRHCKCVCVCVRMCDRFRPVRTCAAETYLWAASEVDAEVARLFVRRLLDVDAVLCEASLSWNPWLLEQRVLPLWAEASVAYAPSSPSGPGDGGDPQT